MVADSDAKDSLDIDLPEGLDDDLGGDWESAFQAEDFMLSLDEESGELFATEAGSDDIDLASLLESDDTEPTKPDSISSAAAEKSAIDLEEESVSPTDRPFSMALLLQSGLTWFQSRPFYQKILFLLLASLPVVALCASLFYTSNNKQLAEQHTEEQEKVIQQAVTDEEQKTVSVAQIAPQEPAISSESAPVISAPPKNRKKWHFPAFLIAAPADKDQDDVVVRVDLSLTLLLEPGQSLPEEKNNHVRDAIYQFYANRPGSELRHFSLARGEMIRKLDAWLKKEWPENPIASIIFERYQVLR